MAEIDAMPNMEWETWQRYIHCQAVLAELAARTNENRAKIRGDS